MVVLSRQPPCNLTPSSSGLLIPLEARPGDGVVPPQEEESTQQACLLLPVRSRPWAGRSGSIIRKPARADCGHVPSAHRIFWIPAPWETEETLHMGGQSRALCDSEAFCLASPISLHHGPIWPRTDTEKVSGLTPACSIFSILANSCGVDPCRINAPNLLQPTTFGLPDLFKRSLWMLPCCLSSADTLLHRQAAHRLYLGSWSALLTLFDSYRTLNLHTPFL